MRGRSEEVAIDLGAEVRAEARAELWRRGSLRHLFHSGQREVYDAIKARPDWTQVVLEISRKWGKSLFLLGLLAEECITHPGERMVYGAPTYGMLKEFVFPIMRWYEAQAPADVRPRFRSDSGHWEFPNGAWVHLFACDDMAAADRGRGPKARRAVYDEAGHVPSPVLSYVLTDVFLPSLMLCDDPLTILSGTPSREPDHAFTQAAEIAEAQGRHFHRTIYDNPMLTPERIEAIIAENAQNSALSPEEYKKTSGFLREYMAARAIDVRLVVVPEWEAAREKLMVAVPRPEFFRGQTVLDFGGNDPHAAIFGYWHFELAKWVIEYDMLLRDGQNTAGLAQAIKNKEREAWGVDKWAGTLRALKTPTAEVLKGLPDWMRDAVYQDAPEQPVSRWCDNDIQLARDLYELHGIAFVPTAKNDKELQVNRLRVMVQAGEVLIHPRCIDTDRHLRTTLWANQRRQDFARRGGEHGDCVDSLVYGARNLDKANPYPPNWASAPKSVAIAAEKRRVEQRKLAEAMMGSTPLGRKLLARR